MSEWAINGFSNWSNFLLENVDDFIAMTYTALWLQRKGLHCWKESRVPQIQQDPHPKPVPDPGNNQTVRAWKHAQYKKSLQALRKHATQTPNSEHLYCVSHDHREVWGADPDPDTEKRKRCSQSWQWANRLSRPKSSSRCFSVCEGAIQKLGQRNQKLNWFEIGKSPEFDVSGTRGRGFSPTYTHILTDAYKLCSSTENRKHEAKLSVYLRLWARAAGSEYSKGITWRVQAAGRRFLCRASQPQRWGEEPRSNAVERLSRSAGKGTPGYRSDWEEVPKRRRSGNLCLDCFHWDKQQKMYSWMQMRKSWH